MPHDPKKLQQDIASQLAPRPTALMRPTTPRPWLWAYHKRGGEPGEPFALITDDLSKDVLIATDSADGHTVIEISDADAEFLLLAVNQADELRDLLRSACAIAERKGQGTAWDRFLASAAKLGLNGITARTYKVLPDDPQPTFGSGTECPDMGEVEANEKAQAERRVGTTGGTY